MSLSKWKELAAEKTKTGQMKQNLFDEIAEKIRSKTTDEAIAKTFRLDRLDQIAEQTRPKARRGVRFQIPRINRDGGIDYAPEVDPYEDMDVEGLLNLEDYVAPEKKDKYLRCQKKRQNMRWIQVFSKYTVSHLHHMKMKSLVYQKAVSGLKDQRSQKIKVIYDFLKRRQK